MENQTHSVITFATNKVSYVQFALNCAQSVLLYNDLPVYIVSNLDFPIPAKFEDKIFIIPAKPEHLPLGIGMKLHIDQYLQTDESLFIDSDCLCYGSLDSLFSDCKGKDIAVAGNITDSNQWCSQAQADVIDREFNLQKLIRYNGGLYYMKNNDATRSIFNNARTIAEKYDEYGFDRIKDKWINEEVPLSIAMMLHHQIPLVDDGTYMTDMYTDHRPQNLNVLKGLRILKNPASPSWQHRPWYPVTYSPVILHFGGSNLSSYPYVSQSILLKLNESGLSAWISTAVVNVFVNLPFRFYYFLKTFK